MTNAETGRTAPTTVLTTELRAAGEASVERVATLAAEVALVAAPSNHEGARARHIAGILERMGYEPEIDEIDNVIVRRGTVGGSAILMMAHTDTVFPADVPLRAEREGDWLCGPGIGDNSTSVAAVLTALAILDEHETTTPADLIVVFNVGEEGLGNLRGARAATDRFAGEISGVLVVDGKIGHVTNGGVGSSRWRVTVTGPGGHSYMHFGRPSAIHGLATIIGNIARIEVPREPKTTLNVGMVSGGTSVNTIAASAEAIVDLRSESAEALAELVASARAAVESLGESGEGLTATVEILGERPAGQLPADTPIVQLAVDSVAALGFDPKLNTSSTDANIPISRGIPAVCIGIYEGEEAHTTNERVFVPSLRLGMVHLLDLMIRTGTL
ncbi:MAG TPA: M20/M25/M40 family metallo-hydrolase [Thermomicrobiales bacterium]|jgi:acetylornithine deacetylase/succinyl-diaminopimelate desuccinylase-like protein|nr:M20/M25/M40 family metallo-hydrolase [Thermomicrobiales bacterium]